MRIVIFGVPNVVSDCEIKEAMSAASEILGRVINVKVIEQNELTNPITFERTEESEFIRAVKSIYKTCGDIVRVPGDRSKFYQLVLEKKIERPILEVISFGPKSTRDYTVLKDMGGNEFIKISQAALSLIVNML